MARRQFKGRWKPIGAPKIPPRQCTAKSKQTGERCKQYPVLGATVCKYHGGYAPNTLRNAAIRLAALVEPSVGIIEKFFRENKGRKVDALQIKVAQDMLDRAGLKSPDRLEVSGGVTDYSKYTEDELRQLESFAIRQQQSIELVSDPKGVSEEGVPPIQAIP